MNDAVGLALLALVVVTAIAVVRLRNLFAATIMLGVYSLLMALTWTQMRALDVAFTEAAVGAGISTILLLGALVKVGFDGSREKYPPRVHLPSLAGAVATGVALLYGTSGMHHLGDPAAPVHGRAARYYMSEAAHEETHAPNMVTAVLASYRGYDTMFETAVIFTAGMGMVLLLRREEQPGVDPAPESGDPAAGGPA